MFNELEVKGRNKTGQKMRRKFKVKVRYFSEQRLTFLYSEVKDPECSKKLCGKYRQGYEWCRSFRDEDRSQEQEQR